MTDLKNKTIVVTGSNRGIGKAIVDSLLANGVKRVYACARNIQSLAFFKDDRVHPVELDITNQTQINDLATLAHDADMLINNAGINTGGKLLNASMEDAIRDTQVNYLGTLAMINSMYPIIERKGRGNIVNIISIVGLAAMPSIAGYSVSKAALFSATQALRTELKEKNITLNAVYPGPVDTDMNEGLDIEMATPADIAEAIVKGIIANEEDIFPDSMAKEVYRMWSEHPKILEENFRQY